MGAVGGIINKNTQKVVTVSRGSDHRGLITQAFLLWGDWCWASGPGPPIWHSSSVQRCWLDGVEVGALWRPVEVFHTKLGKPFLFWSGFVHMGILKFTRKTNVANKFEACYCLKYHVWCSTKIYINCKPNNENNPQKNTPDQTPEPSRQVPFFWHVLNPELPTNCIIYLKKPNYFPTYVASTYLQDRRSSFTLSLTISYCGLYE